MFHPHKFGFKPWREHFFQKGDFKFIILGLLKEKPYYGYEIIRALEERFHGFYSPSPGIVYPNFQMLEQLGYVTSSEQDDKKVYAITDRGREFLAKWERRRGEVVEQMDKWRNLEVHSKLDKITGELWEIGQLVGYGAHEMDAFRLERIKEVLFQTRKDIEAIFKERG